jgi:CRISPR-associated exonuclease Cas4
VQVDNKPGVEARQDLRIERALPPWNVILGLIGKADAVEFDPDAWRAHAVHQRVARASRRARGLKQAITTSVGQT